MALDFPDGMCKSMSLSQAGRQANLVNTERDASGLLGAREKKRGKGGREGKGVIYVDIQ